MTAATWNLEAEHPFGNRLRARRYRLKNGLRLVIVPDPAAPIFSYQTWYGVGSRNEQPGRTGMAHLFEHLMFNQTAHLAPGEFDRLIESTGGDTNAATWVDWTYYRDSLPARDLELAVRLEADRMEHLTLDTTQVEAEREVVANERLERVDDDVDGFLDEQLFALAFERHPYHWPTIGWMDDIRGMREDDIRAFYRTWYAPNNAAVILVGDVDEPAALDLIERYYGGIAPAELPSPEVPAEPPQAGERSARFAKPVGADRLVVGYHCPAQGDPDWPALEILASLLSGGASARLYRRLVVERQAATSVDSHPAPFRDPGLFRLSINMAREHRADEGLAELDAALERLHAEPVPEDELAKVKNCVETDFWSALADADGKAEALGHYEMTLGDFRRLFDVADRLARVSADDVRRVARQYLQPSQRTVVVAEPDGDDA